MATLPTERNRDRLALASPCPKMQLETEAKAQKHMKVRGSSNDRYIKTPVGRKNPARLPAHARSVRHLGQLAGNISRSAASRRIRPVDNQQEQMYPPVVYQKE